MKVGALRDRMHSIRSRFFRESREARSHGRDKKFRRLFPQSGGDAEEPPGRPRLCSCEDAESRPGSAQSFAGRALQPLAMRKNPGEWAKNGGLGLAAVPRRSFSESAWRGE